MAGKHLFARYGYENTSTVAISREAGTSESQMMKHFGSKQGLLAAIFERGWVAITERVKVINDRVSLSEKLFAVLEAMVIELENDPELKEIMMLEARRVRKDNRDVLLAQGFQRFAQILDGILEEMRAQGQIHGDVHPQAVRAACIGVTEGLLRDQVVAKRSEFPAAYDFDDIRRTLEMFVSSFSGDRAQRLKAANE